MKDENEEKLKEGSKKQKWMKIKKKTRLNKMKKRKLLESKNEKNANVQK